MIGQLLSGRYKVQRILGAGGFGQTFVAEDTQRPNNPVCVVKQLKPASNDPSFLETARRMFRSEGEVLEKLGENPQIPRLLANFEQDQEFYLVQEYIDGQTLSAELQIGKKWTENQVVDLLKQILSVLAFVHQNGVIHRDVKPDNIIRRKSDNKLVLVDFGAVKQVRNQTAMGQKMLSATIAIGTPGYMPSEQGIGKPKPSSDIYALGVIAIQALTGLSPSPQQEDTDTGFRYDHNTGELVWQDKVQVSPNLAAILTKMVKHNFPERYASAVEALQALEQLHSGYTPTVQVAPQSYQPTLQIIPPENRPSHAPTLPVSNPTKPQDPTIHQYDRSLSNKLLFAGAIFLSLLTAGGIFYLQSLKINDDKKMLGQLATKTPEVQPAKTPEVQPAKTPEVQPAKTPEVQPAKTPEVQPAKTPEVQPAKTPEVQPTKTPQTIITLRAISATFILNPYDTSCDATNDKKLQCICKIPHGATVTLLEPHNPFNINYRFVKYKEPLMAYGNDEGSILLPCNINPAALLKSEWEGW
ncbi:protein kinase [Pseudanabaena sp. SR411]|uniref:protein kinase domain-containing protein n=1 Tax=Pseudanabaena sp. SR411 TaxID=1980935 RepID=UPI0011403BA9|nr:protein kinase [Pseudanabaena sp. SR411]